MARRRVLLTLEDTGPVVSSAMSLTAPAKLQNSPAGFNIDSTFPAMPIHHHSARQTAMAMASGTVSPRSVNRFGAASYVVRGWVDSDDLPAAMQHAKTADGKPRLFSDPDIAGFATCGGDPPVGSSLDIKRLLGVGRLQQLGMDGSGVALAIVDTGVNLPYLRGRGLTPNLDVHASWSSPISQLTPGAAPVAHGTMCAYDAMLTAPNALLFDHAVLAGAAPGGSIMSGTLSNAVASYSKLLQLMGSSAEERNFHSLVVSNSWGMFDEAWDFPPGSPGRYADNLNHPFNILVGNLAAAGADILFAAGNCGPTCPDGRCSHPVPKIFLANCHPDVTCVAGVDALKALVGYSSQGPDILGGQKPDLASYTHFLGSEVFGAGQPDSGTSAACPVLAGVVAALRSVYPFDPAIANRAPANIRQFLIAGATGGTGAWQADLGHGIVDTSGFAGAAPTLH